MHAYLLHLAGSAKWSGTPVTLRVSRRPKRRGLAIFLVPEVVIEIAAMAVPVGLAPASNTVDNRAPRRLRLRNPWRGCDKWWELVVMLHRSPSGTFFDGRFTVG